MKATANLCVRNALAAFTFLLILTLSFYNETIFGQDLANLEKGKINSMPTKVGLRFSENKGQIADMNTGKPRPDILFSSSHNGIQLFFHNTGIDYQFRREFRKPLNDDKKRSPDQLLTGKNDIDSIQTYRVELRLLGANPNPSVTKEEEGKDVENYYLAHCPDGILGVKNFQKIRYADIYPNIDWVIYSSNGIMKYDFVVHPGGNVNNIRVQYRGGDRLSIDEVGRLQVFTNFGNITEDKPVSFQGHHEVIASHFNLKGNIISIETSKYNSNETLFIDPGIVWSTYYGGTGSDDLGNSVVTDAAGEVYMGGQTNSTAGISSGGFQNTYSNNDDLMLVKFTAGCARLWATYYGGSGADYMAKCALDEAGNVYLSGVTTTVSGLASGGFQNANAGQEDVILAKFSGAGIRLWATYYGGTNYEGAYFCTTDINDNVYISGPTYSTSGIASGGFQNSIGGGRDGFLVKFSPTGARLWGTYYGGSDTEYGTACCTDPSGNVYLTGQTTSVSGIASGGFQNNIAGAGDGFLVKFSSTGARLWATYYGGPGEDFCGLCKADAAGNVYLGGGTASASGISYCGFQNTYYPGDVDEFIVKFSASGSRTWATYFGGPGFDGNGFGSTDMALDQAGNIYMCGITNSTSGIAFNGFQNTLSGTYDAYLVKLTGSGTRVWATYFGGDGDDRAFGCTVDVTGNIYMCGATHSLTGLAMNGFQNTNGGGIFPAIQDAFLCGVSNPVIAEPEISSFTTSTPCIATTGTIVTITGINFTGATNVGFGEAPATSFTVINDNTIEATVGLGASGTILVTTPNGTTPFCGFVYCSIVDLASVSITANPGNNICVGTNVTFTAIPVNGGSSPVYQWTVNGGNVGTNSATYSSNALNNGDVISCTLLSNANCVQCTPVAGNLITMIVSPPAPAAVTITASVTTICQGNTVDFTATPVNGGTTPVYQWQINGINTGTNSNTYSSTTLSNADVVTCLLTSNASCASPASATSNAITITVNTAVIPSISIGTSATSICAGSSVSFTAVPVNGGTTPAFQWQVNGINTGTNSSAFTTTALNNGDIIACILTSNVPCSSQGIVVSNNIVMQVNAAIVPSININAVPAGICSGFLLNLSTVITNGGTNPVYQWQVNGINVGNNSSTYASNTFNNGDIVTCLLTSNESCASPAIVTSAPATIQVEQSLTPTISINASSNPVCPGAQVNFTASITNGGPVPSYQWQVNALNVGTNTATYSSNTLSNADVVSCTMITSLGCFTTVSASSSITITIGNNLFIDAGGPLSIHVGGSVQATAIVTGGNTNLASILWTPSAGLSNATVLNPVVTPLTVSDEVEYTITIINTDGCSATDELIVNVFSDCLDNVRNAFTPNGDGRNDLWLVYDDYSCLKNVNVVVFNRYGTIVFESGDYRNNWDGRYKGKLLPDGTYYAVINFTLRNGVIRTIKTDITLLR